MSEKTPLEYVSSITEINDMSVFMQDEKLDEALDLIIKMTVKPHVPGDRIGPVIVLARALAAEMQLKGKYYMLLEKDTQKKNIYLTVAQELVGLCDSLKYLAK